MITTNISLVTAPANDILTISEAKTHLRVDLSSDDTYIENLIKLCTKSAENYTSRAFITQTYKIFFDNYYDNSLDDTWWNGIVQGRVGNFIEKKYIELPFAPLQSVTHFKTYDEDDNATTFSSDNYSVSSYFGDFANRGRISLKNGNSWPTYTKPIDGIEIQFVCGYGDNASDVPLQIKQGVLEEIAFRYEHRGDRLDQQKINSDISQGLLSQFKIF